MNQTTLPPFLMTSEEGSFAQKTIQERNPSIIDRILTHNDYTPQIRQDLLNFKAELSSGHVQILTEKTSDSQMWNELIAPYQNTTWFNLPWFLAEAYFYRRILEIVSYFQPGPWMNIDPFAQMKKDDILDGMAVFKDLYPRMQQNNSYDNFRDACLKALWGNRGDLSYLDISDADMSPQQEKLLIDHTEDAYRFLSGKGQKIAYIFDNVGKELFFDFAFIDHLLQTGLASSVTCYLKNQPFFVSDAMPVDFINTLNHMHASSQPEIEVLAERVKTSLFSGEINLEAPLFFTSALMMRDMPAVLGTQIGSHDLAILKGDANYRRLFGDRHWHPTTTIEEAGGYFPTSFISLRTLKAEIAVGLSQNELSQIENEAEPDWLINGKRGMITFYQKSA